ncbi:MAG: CapA family protein [Spirochaetales bacterium]|nr:CapA family protein [Spirochaetales bacterium]
MGCRRLALIAILSLLLGARSDRLLAETQRLYLSFLGDIMIHTANYLSPDYDAIYASLRPILLRDTLSFANLEFPVDPTRGYSSYPRFNAPREYLRAAVVAGIEVFSLANNHAADQDLEGIRGTLRSLEEVGRQAFRRVYHHGTRASLEEPFAPVEIRAKGVRIGFMAVTQVVNWPLPGPYVHVVDYANPRHRERFLPYIETVACDFDLFVLSYHGGREYAAEPEEAKVRFFRELVERGVDVVYGHHPHVLQRYELIDRQEGPGLILCSTGNLLSGMTACVDPGEASDPRAWTGDSALWLVVVQVGDGRAEVEQVMPLPISNYRDRHGAIGVHTFAALAGEGLPEPWLSYYRERHGALRALFRRWAARPSDR